MVIWEMNGVRHGAWCMNARGALVGDCLLSFSPPHHHPYLSLAMVVLGEVIEGL